jgi:predicted nucleic-acid-binding protein
MIGLDTNVLVRYLVQDDPEQGGAASRAIRAAVEGQEPLFLCGTVLCETVWVLETAYDHEREAVADVLDRILLSDRFEVERRDEVAAALRAYGAARGDFADYLIGHVNAARGCARTLTFHRALHGTAGFEAP